MDSQGWNNLFYLLPKSSVSEIKLNVVSVLSFESQFWYLKKYFSAHPYLSKILIIIKYSSLSSFNGTLNNILIIQMIPYYITQHIQVIINV